MTTRDIPFYLNHVPLHRMNQLLTRVWVFGGEPRKQMVRSLCGRYKGGVGLCSASLHLVAFIAPDETYRELPPPHRQYEMWQMANKPQAPECPCMAFIDIENGGRPWRERGTDRHHPLCQWERSAKDVFVRYGQLEAQGKARPDDLTRVRDSIEKG